LLAHLLAVGRKVLLDVLSQRARRISSTRPPQGGKLPSSLPPFREKIVGLSITPERLSEIRHERRAGSKYASIENCRYEVNEAEQMMKREGIRWLSSTTKSIEEIATTVLQEIMPDRRDY
jgi:regulator of PEP synthase PpsR (kinase-PPPase family)